MKTSFTSIFKGSREQIYNRWFRFINFIPKRVRIVVCVLMMLALLLVSTFFPFVESWYIFIIVFFLGSYFTTYIAVFEGLDGVEWFTLFIMPVLLTLTLYLFFSLLPVRWLTRLPYLMIFGFSYYAILLTSNIFNIGVEKSLQLYRAAFSVNYLLQTCIIFLSILATFTFKQHFIVNALVIGIVSFLLSIQLFWTVKPEHAFDRQLLRLGSGVAVLMFQLGIIISFLPLSTTIAALLSTACYYSLTGLVYHAQEEKLYKNVIREYSFVFFFVVLIVLLTLQW
ncbi:MAG: hypothetical protein ACEQSA_05380 [Weeksellaceae bacterium]